MKYLIAALCCITLLYTPLHAQDATRFLKESTMYPLRSIQAADSDYSDLAFLKAVLKNKRIVLLGEQSHGDGATFDAKVRLVKFLHEQAGFDLLSFESGLYDNYKANALLQQTDAANSPLKESVFPIWSDTKELQPLIQYLHSESRTSHPLLLSGFDCQEETLFASHYLPELREALGTSLQLSEEESSNLDIVVSSGAELLAGSPGDSVTFFHMAGKISKALDKQIDRHPGPHLSMLRQTFISWLNAIRFQIDDINEQHVAVQNPRDWQMAQNLIFLSQMYPDKKIICWGASYHFARSMTSVLTDTRITKQAIQAMDSILKNDEPGAIDLKDALPMGQLLADRFGDSLYSIAFSSFDGSFGMLDTKAIPMAIMPPPPGSLEAALLQKNMPLAFVDHKKTTRQESSFFASILGNVPIQAPWGNMFDGYIFIRTSYPPSASIMEGTVTTQAQPSPQISIAAAPYPETGTKSVVDATSREGLDYVSIALYNSDKGVLSNGNGSFIFNIPEAGPEDKVVLSAIGYETLVLPVKDFNKKNIFELQPKQYELESVTVSSKALSARDIVKRAEKRIRDNYYQNASQQEFFFRARSLAEDSIPFNEEASVLIDNPEGFHTGVNGNLKGRILQFRNTTANASARKWEGVGSLWLMYSHNMIVQKSNALHRTAFYTYTRLGTTELEQRKVYKIGFVCKRPMSFTTGFGYPAPQSATGTLYIDMENFALLKMEMSVRRKPLISRKDPDMTTDPWVHYLVETYKQYQGKYFLNSSRQIHYSRNTNHKTHISRRVAQVSELLSTGIRLEGSGAPEQALLPLPQIKSGMVTEDRNFWNTHNFQVGLPAQEVYRLIEENINMDTFKTE